MKVIRKKAITASSQIQSAENDKILFSDWIKKTYGINRDDIPSADFDKYLNEYKEYKSGSNIVRYNYFEDIESSEDVTSIYKMKETIDKNRKYNEGRNDTDYLENVVPVYEEYFSAHPGYSTDLLFGILNHNDDRYQDIFNQLKGRGYNPRATNYIDRIATDAITIDLSEREIPEEVLDITEKYPELSIRHLNFHKGANSYKAKFELWDEDFRELKEKAYAAIRDKRRTKVESAEEVLCSEVYECMDDYTIGDKGQWIDEEELEIFYDQMKEDDPVVQEYDSFEAWLEDTVNNGYLRKVSEDEMLESVEASEDVIDYKKDRRLFPTNIRYKGYLVVLDRGGDGYNVYDKYRELEDCGFGSLDDAKKFVDEITSCFTIQSSYTQEESTKVIESSESTAKWWMAKYYPAEGKVKKVYFEGPSSIDKAEKVFKDWIPEPYTKVVFLGSTPNMSDDYMKSEGFEKVIIKSSVTAAEEADENDLEQTEQEFTSKDTSINKAKLPAIYKMVSFQPGQVVLDYGGGRYDNGSEYLAELGATGLVYDPYNREASHNRNVIKQIRENGGADVTLCSNVLNVIKEPEARLTVLKNIRKLLKPSGKVYITVYEGSGTGEGKQSQEDAYQLNRKTKDYMDEVRMVFPDAQRKGKLIVATPATNIKSSKKVAASKLTESLRDRIFDFIETLEVTDSYDYLLEQVSDEFKMDPGAVEDYVKEFYKSKEFSEWHDTADQEDIEASYKASGRKYTTDHINRCPHCTNMTLQEVDDGLYVCEDCGAEFWGYPAFKGGLYLEEISEDVQASEKIEAKLIEPPQSVVTELLHILSVYGFELDKRFKVNPGKTWMGNAHVQVINPESYVYDTSELREFVPRAMIDKIHALEQETDCPITWNFGVDDNYQVTGGLDINKKWIKDDEDETSKDKIESSSKINLPAYAVQFVTGYAGNGVNNTDIKYFRKEEDRDKFVDKLKARNVIGIKTYKIDNFYHTEDVNASSDIRPYNTDKEHMMMFYVGPGGYLQKDILDYAKSKGHNYFYWGSDEAWSYDFHGGYNGDTIVTYDDADNLPDWYRDDAIRYGKPIKVNNNVASRIQAANYGGAYDIDEEMYFTKDEIVEFAQDVVDDFNTMQDAVFDLYSVYFVGDRNDILQIEITDGDYDFNHEERIDMRRIRKPSDLYKYKDKFVYGLIKEYKEFQDMMNGVEYVVSSSTLSKRDLETLSKKAVEVTTIDDLNRVISLLRIHDENKWAHYSELARSGEYSPAAIGKMISDDLYQELQDEVEGSEKIEAKQKMSPWKVKKIIKDLNDDLYNKASKVMQSEDFGFTLDDIADYLVIEVEEIPEGIKAEVRAKLTYSGMEELAQNLNPVVEKYNKDAYFDHVCPDIIDAYIYLDKQQLVNSAEIIKLEDDSEYEESVEDEKQYEVPFDGYVTVENDTIKFKSIDTIEPIEDEDYGYMKIDDQRGIEYNITELIAPNVPEEDGKYHVKGVAKLSYYLTGVHEEYEDTYDDYESYKSYNTELATVEFNEKGSWIEDLQFVEE